MSVTKIKQEALQLADHDKRNVRTQFGALCWRRRGDEVQVLLVTSKRSQRWILPKGWPMHDATPAEAALTEAWEEAGVVGKVKTICLGIFSYQKELSDESNLPCVVAVFPVKVKTLEKFWPEKEQRQRKWYSLKQAANLVDEPELSAILKKFDPSAL
jgi:8-oxo-dGTP pyrophosphatase MutT (NUDIX family)